MDRIKWFIELASAALAVLMCSSKVGETDGSSCGGWWPVWWPSRSAATTAARFCDSSWAQAGVTVGGSNASGFGCGSVVVRADPDGSHSRY